MKLSSDPDDRCLLRSQCLESFLDYLFTRLSLMTSNFHQNQFKIQENHNWKIHPDSLIFSSKSLFFFLDWTATIWDLTQYHQAQLKVDLWDILFENWMFFSLDFFVLFWSKNCFDFSWIDHQIRSSKKAANSKVTLLWTPLSRTYFILALTRALSLPFVSSRSR